MSSPCLLVAPRASSMGGSDECPPSVVFASGVGRLPGLIRTTSEDAQMDEVECRPQHATSDHADAATLSNSAFGRGNRAIVAGGPASPSVNDDDDTVHTAANEGWV